eukprot:234644-Chlamydomonas_euryale.AAC.6
MIGRGHACTTRSGTGQSRYGREPEAPPMTRSKCERLGARVGGVGRGPRMRCRNSATAVEKQVWQWGERVRGGGCGGRRGTWTHCVDALHGRTAWTHCMDALHMPACMAWLQHLFRARAHGRA